MPTQKPKGERAGKRTIRISPRRALEEVRKRVAQPTRIEDSELRYRRTRSKRTTHEIVVEDTEGC